MKLENKADNFVRENVSFIQQAMEEGGTWRKAITLLNARGVKTPRNKIWYVSSLKNFANRMEDLGLYCPLLEEQGRKGTTMSAENAPVDTMGFEPAVAYDVPEFGNVHVLMRDGEPWFIGTELGRILNSKKAPSWLNVYTKKYKNFRNFCIFLSADAMRCLVFNKAFTSRDLVINSVSVLRKCAEKLRYKERQKLYKLLSWAQNKFGKDYNNDKLLPFAKYGKLEVVFYQHKILVSARSLNISLGRYSIGSFTGSRTKDGLRSLLVYLNRDDARVLGLKCRGKLAVRICITIDGAKEYLKTFCESPNRTTVLEWIEREVEPAARKHLAALEAQEAKETKEMSEETPMLPNTETASPVAAAPAVPTYEDLLAPWRATLKAQEDTLKELEAVKADLASRVARIDEQNADIKTLVENNNAFQDERRKLKEEIEDKEKEIESLKNSIIELEDKVAIKEKQHAEDEEALTSIYDKHLKTCLKREALEKRYNELKEAAEKSLENYIGSYYFGISDPDESLQQLIKEMEAYKEICDEESERLEEKNKELAQMKAALAAKDAELAKFKAFKDMMQSFMQTTN